MLVVVAQLRLVAVDLAVELGALLRDQPADPRLLGFEPLACLVRIHGRRVPTSVRAGRGASRARPVGRVGQPRPSRSSQQLGRLDEQLRRGGRAAPPGRRARGAAARRAGRAARARTPRRRPAPGRRRARRRTPAPAAPSSVTSARTRRRPLLDRTRALAVGAGRAASSSTTSTAASGYGSSGSHSRTRSRAVPTVDQRVAAVGEPARLDDPRDRPDVEARVAATDLGAALDEDHAELRLTGGEAVLDERAVARLEHVQREHGVREQHRPEREHREDARWPRSLSSPGRRSARASAATVVAFGPSSPSASASSAGGRLGEPAERAEQRRGLPPLARPAARRSASRSRAAHTASTEPALEVRALQVVEHAQQDRPRARSARGTPARTATSGPVQRGEDLATALDVEHAPGVEGIDEDVGLVVDAHEEVAGHARRRAARARCAGRPRSSGCSSVIGMPEPPVDDVVEQRVARVGVVLDVAREALGRRTAPRRAPRASGASTQRPAISSSRTSQLVEVQARDARARRRGTRPRRAAGRLRRARAAR